MISISQLRDEISRDAYVKEMIKRFKKIKEERFQIYDPRVLHFYHRESKCGRFSF
jgi:hypothetical protein